ncbi:MAG: hypothetical protein G8D24_01510 [Buchnera aphidicola (Periphyllus lyropictus)]|uniref:HisA/HisF-related TIM barrel protein n=1 Tax=Buchnera aphidicola TaxID=9 RepID=UPI001EBEF76C|nr:HisA/HisF-related TIM barrel protein [Buchnera aphidicola]NIH16727.1 hypothetical protein [Buchnera aphidicola (Periphyllus lyropictus)]USS94631.1 HisA/HisF-related TIM barrel protein [Buchnera aphidicola (Periphyllus lyropictus)]
MKKIIKNFSKIGIKCILSKDISKNGILNSSNIFLYLELIKKFPNISFKVSKGVVSLEDIVNLKKLELRIL